MSDTIRMELVDDATGAVVKEADVHRDEVKTWEAGGWRKKAKAGKAPSPVKRPTLTPVFNRGKAE